MRVSPSLKAYWQRQHQLEVRLQKEAEIKHEILKKAAKKEIEVTIYEKYLQKLYLVKQARLGKNIDREV